MTQQERLHGQGKGESAGIGDWKRTISLGALCGLLFAGFCSPEPAPPAADTHSTDACFGIPGDFSGRLTPEQEKSVPPALRGAFRVEHVRDIQANSLEPLLKNKTLMAEETRDGVRYVALKDFRCVHFDAETSGMMIIIERYRVTAPSHPATPPAPDALKAKAALLNAMRQPKNPFEGADPARFETVPLERKSDTEYTWGAFHLHTAQRTFNADIASSSLGLFVSGRFIVEADGSWKAVDIRSTRAVGKP